MGPIDPVMSCARGQTLRQPVHVGGLTQCLHIEHYLSRAAGTLGVDWSYRRALTRNGLETRSSHARDPEAAQDLVVRR